MTNHTLRGHELRRRPAHHGRRHVRHVGHDFHPHNTRERKTNRVGRHRKSCRTCRTCQPGAARLFERGRAPCGRQNAHMCAI
jgi:hypothetical protein